MGLKDRLRGPAFELDDAVRRVLVEWGKEHDPALSRLVLKRALMKLKPEQKKQLMQRLAEVALGQLFILDKEAQSAADSNDDSTPKADG